MPIPTPTPRGAPGVGPQSRENGSGEEPLRRNRSITEPSTAIRHLKNRQLITARQARLGHHVQGREGDHVQRT